MTIQTGDTVTIRRGNLKGKQGDAIAIEGKSIVIKLQDGTFSVQNETNVRAPEQATITEGDLAAIISTEANVGVGDFESLVHALDAKLPGFAQRVSLPTLTEPAYRDETPGHLPQYS